MTASTSPTPVTTHNLGFPRIGARRELKFAQEAYWRGEMDAAQLAEIIEIFPELGKGEWQGLEAARPILRRFEVAALAA